MTPKDYVGGTLPHQDPLYTKKHLGLSFKKLISSPLVVPKLGKCGSNLEEEVPKTIWAICNEKAPNPDGFTGAFFQSCWDIIKGDSMMVFQEFYLYGKICGNELNLHNYNT